ncbi:MAG: SusC/RagA family TonB-linked outer membrane protein [Flavobacteriaceae bacterium]
MIQKCLKLLFIFCLFGSAPLLAQTNITGVVTDGSSGVPLIGANILVKGTTNGVSTDFDGKYNIDVSNTSGTLVFSYVGYQTKEIAINGQSSINVTLTEDTSQLDEVVVTALGIKKEEKALGYATSTIQAEEITKTASPNFATALYGKATGVQIAATPGGSTSGVNITIRGINSITGKSQPLIVMDGVPIRDGEVNNSNYWNDQRLRGNGLLDLNPEDIENISILKGASAAALYGSEAVNGVVLVTTKKGKSGKVTVDFSTSFGTDILAYQPNYQYVRGAGLPLNYYGGDFSSVDTDGDGVGDTRGFPTYSSYAFGPKYDGEPMMYWDGVVRPYLPQKNGHKSIFQNAYNTRSNISVSSGNDKANVRFSYTRQENEGLSLNSQDNKNMFNLNTSFKIADNLTTDLMVNYIDQKVENRPYSIARLTDNFAGMIAPYDNSKWYASRYQTSLGYRYVTGTNQSLTPDENIRYTRGFKNDLMDYFWRVNKMNLVEKSDRVIAVLTTTWDISDKFKLRGRVSNDFTNRNSTDNRNTQVPLAFGNSGEVQLIDENDKITYGDLLLTFTTPLTDDLNMTLMGGINGSKQSYSRQFARTNGGLSVENWFDLNASNQTVVANASKSYLLKDALLATANFDYKGFLFLEGTIRRDRTSTMNPDNNSFTYPSVNSSFVFSEAFDLPEFITYGKLRGSYGIVGNYPDVYAANIAYTQTSLGTQGISSPIYTTVSTGQFGNDYVKPEEKHEYEFGLEMKFLQGKLGFDFSYYNAKIIDQILPLTLPNTTGASSILTNIGTLRNTGLELGINFNPIETENFSWDGVLNISRNRNKIEQLVPGLDEIIHSNYDSNAAELRSVVGQAMGDFYTHPVERHANGEMIVDPNGLYRVSDEWEKTGNVMPDAIGGLLNSLRYKNWTFDFALDFSYGGDIMPRGLNWLTSLGYTEKSLGYMDTEHGGLSYYEDGSGTRILVNTGTASGPGGETVYNDGIIFPGVKQDGTTNDYIASSASYWDNTYGWGGPGYNRNTRYELFVEENNYIKVREMSLGYSFPRKLTDRIGFKNLNLSVYGRNLFFIYKSIDDMDPEQMTAGSRWFQSVSTMGTNPSSRSFGVMLRASL